MKKFVDVVKKQEQQQNSTKDIAITESFKTVYGNLLSDYKVTSIQQLTKTDLKAFECHVSQYFDNYNGLTEAGKNYVRTRALDLNESSSPIQKANYLKTKLASKLNVIMNEHTIKYSVYEAIDEIYSATKAVRIGDVLTPETVGKLVKENLEAKINSIVEHIMIELKESSDAIVDGHDIEEITKHYLIAAIWAEGGLDDYVTSDVDTASYHKAYDDCKAFVEKAHRWLGGISDEQIGHDILLTRNGHGAGFWNRGYSEEVGEKLSNIAKEMGEVYTFERDGKIVVE